MSKRLEVIKKHNMAQNDFMIECDYLQFGALLIMTLLDDENKKILQEMINISSSKSDYIAKEFIIGHMIKPVLEGFMDEEFGDEFDDDEECEDDECPEQWWEKKDE